MRRSRVVTTVAVLAIAMAGLAACDGAGAPAHTPATATPASSPASTGACVADPAAVVARKLPAAASGELPATTVSLLDAAVTAALPQAAAPGAIVAVRSPQGTWIKAYGVTDPATQTPMTTDLYQRIGSVTKTFTGTLILRLAQDGKLNLDDKLEKYVSGMPNGDTVTIRQLASMVSGLASYTLDENWQKAFFGDPNKVWTPDELVDVARGLTPLFAPGAKFDYSNTNTILLGKVIEKVTGEPYEKVLQDDILTPLKLTHTSFPGESAAFPSPHAQGFTLQATAATPDKPVITTDWDPSWGWTAGEIISSMDDLLVYGRALGTGQGMLSAEMQQERLTSFPNPRNQPSYGFALGCGNGWIGHTGELPGYNTSVYYQTDTDTTVITMANSDISSGTCSQSAVLQDGLWGKTTTGIPCSAPAPRLFFAVAAALGRPYPAPPQN